MNIALILSVSLCNAARADGASSGKSEEFERLVLPGAKIERVAGGFSFTEGPAWSKDGYLIFSDIPAGIIRKWEPDGKVTILNHRSGNANGLTFDAKGRLIACEHGNRRVTRTELDGSTTVIADKYEGRRLNSPNDLVVKSDGSIYFTDPPYGVRPEDRDLSFQGVYRVVPGGKVTLLTKEMKGPNGLAFSPDEKTLYVADSSERRHIKAFDVDADGTLKSGRVFAAFKAGAEGPPDGMTVDTKGNVWSTGPGGIWVFNSAGAHLGTINIPQVAANCAWGNEDGKALYVTASTAIYRIQTEAVGIRPWMRRESGNSSDNGPK